MIRLYRVRDAPRPSRGPDPTERTSASPAKHNSGRHREPLDRLTGNLRDELKVPINVQHGI
ncbi:MAG TPA: hypothetical protein PKG51_09885, partial [Arachnia sp.]|nr:hypothetical protein [Arachnia sp.]